MIRDVIACLRPVPSEDVAGAYALSVAQAFSAHLEAVAFAYEPAVPPTIMAGMAAEIIANERRDSEDAATACIAHFEEAARRQGVAVGSRMMSVSITAASGLFGSMARRFDMSVIGQAIEQRSVPETLIIEAALFDSGRPVVVVPYIHRAPLKLERVMICWDGSRSASRAIADALPFLARARRIEVVIVSGREVKTRELPGADIGQHLARHQLAVEVKEIATGIDVANALLSYAAESATDFIVMGGYGHSRLREFVLGGATRGVLHSMTVPVLMSH